MGLLETLGIARKRARPVGQQLEHGRPTEEPSARQHWLVKGGIFAALLCTTALAFPRGEVYEYTVQVGETWRQQTLVAPFDFPVYKDPATLERERRSVRETTPPYFRDVTDAQEQMQANRDSVAAQLEYLFGVYADYLRAAAEGDAEAAERDSLRYVDLRRDARPRLAPGQWRLVARAYAARQPGLATEAPPGTEAGPLLSEQLLQSAWEFGVQLTDLGVMNVPRTEVETEQIIVRNEAERVDRSQLKDRVYGLNEAYQYAREDYFPAEYSERPAWAAIADAFFRAIFEPSLEYMRAETVENWRRREARISPTRGVVQAGEVVVQKGEEITEEVKRGLTSLERVQNESQGVSILWMQIAAEVVLALVTFLIFFLYLFFLRPDIFYDNRAILLMALLFAMIIGLFALVVRVPAVGLYVVPVAIASVQLTIMFDSRVGIFGTLVLALIGGQLLGFDLEYFMATFFAGMLGVFSVRDIKNRGQYFLSGGLVLVGYLLVLAGAWLYFDTPAERIASDVGLVAVNSFIVVMAYPLLWVFERAFDITTDLTLLELSDTNRKLLKELSLRAPGSFNHSLQVANLAEAAADAVGANALLTRVGALYHDVGKMLKPEYFVENQRTGDNPHDRLKPRMSALIIASHVKEGLELARQHNLPQRVLDFIPAHHGTTRIEYFYRKALENAEEGEAAAKEPYVLESEFRYPGPRPRTRETAILMLADGVEAASRSLEEPTHKRLESVIDAIFRTRIDDGQLDDTDLTFRDMTTIKQTFLSMLVGIYHVRVRYPDKDEEDAKPARPAPGPAPPAKAPAATGEGDAAREEAASEEAAAGEASRATRPNETVRDVREHGLWGIPEQSVRSRPRRDVPGSLKEEVLAVERMPEARGGGARGGDTSGDGTSGEGASPDTSAGASARHVPAHPPGVPPGVGAPAPDEQKTPGEREAS